MYNFAPLKQKLADISEWLTGELAQVRTGRATPAILDKIHVEAYGSQMPLNQIGSITIEDARTLRISLWDSSHAKAVEKEIGQANLGLSVSVDEKGLRVFFPELTTERRTVLLKLAKEKLESARISVRAERDKVSKEIDTKEKEGGMGEDEKFRFKNDMQKLIDEANKKLEDLYARKEKEIQQ